MPMTSSSSFSLTIKQTISWLTLQQWNLALHLKLNSPIRQPSQVVFFFYCSAVGMAILLPLEKIMKFRIAKKIIKNQIGIVLRKTYPNCGYLVCCPHGYSQLQGMVGSNTIPELEIEQVRQWDSRTMCVDISF